MGDPGSIPGRCRAKWFLVLNGSHLSTFGSFFIAANVRVESGHLKQLVGLVQQLVGSHISCYEILKKRRVRRRNRSLDGNYALLVLLVWSW